MTGTQPTPQVVPEEWPHRELHTHVTGVLKSLPFHFFSTTTIEGISALDIFTLNSALGATIEEQVVSALNRQRSVWDPDDKYTSYGFSRQTQRFPDVVFHRMDQDPAGREVLFGIELKGWYVLAKERVPSFRFNVTPAVCAPQDLIVVVPWVLENVLSGRPKVAAVPYIQPARFAAEMRNYYWQHIRTTTADRGITHPEVDTFYPRKDEKIADQPKYDAGGNFGRYFVRSGILSDYTVDVLNNTMVAGVPAGAWIDFFKLFTDGTGGPDAGAELARLEHRWATVKEDAEDAELVDELVELLKRHLDLAE